MALFFQKIGSILWVNLFWHVLSIFFFVGCGCGEFSEFFNLSQWSSNLVIVPPEISFASPMHDGKLHQLPATISCLNFWDEVWWFLSLRVFGLLSSSLLLFQQHFDWYVLQPSSGVCWTREPSQNFKLRPLFNPDCRQVTIQEYLTLVPSYG